MKRKFSTQDIIVYVAVAGVGLILFSIILFTDVVFYSEEGTQISAENNFNAVNTKVATKPVDEHASKLELYDEELISEEALSRKDRADLEEDALAKPLPVNDLSSFLETKKEDETKLHKEAQTTPKIPVSQRKTIIKKDEPRQELAQEEVTTQKKRRDDPTFGTEESESATHTEPKPSIASQQIYSAVIQGEQTIKSGNRMTIRLLQDVSLEGCALPANTRLTGVATITDQRIHVRFAACQRQKSIVSFSLFDVTDGNEGLYVENLNEGQELKSEALGDAVGETASTLGVPVLDKLTRSARTKRLQSPAVTLQSGSPVSLVVVNPKL